uniref:Uncharacterized protein n=1 Tax=Setaria italica TaxID=4555 RepID=K3ZFP5_SETIT
MKLKSFYFLVSDSISHVCVGCSWWCMCTLYIYVVATYS